MADVINACFECGAGLLVLNHCRVLRAERMVRGVSLLSVAIFTLWGVWNMYYYPSLSQWWSFAGGFFVTLANGLYCSQLAYYRVMEGITREQEEEQR